MAWGHIAIAEDVLDRIVILLLALADIAERAAGAPEARRCLTLAIVHSGAIAAADAFDPTRDPAEDETDAPEAYPCASPEDAQGLAVGLRFLALLLHTTVRKHCLSAELAPDLGGAHDGGPSSHRRESIACASAAASTQPAYADTS